MREIPVIMFTPLDGAAAASAALEASADDYLTDPFTARELLATLNAHLRIARLRRESDERFRALVEASAQIVWLTDADGLVCEDSPSWRAFTGQATADWLGWGWLEALHPDDRTRSAAVWSQARASGRLYEVEYRVWHAASRTYRWTLARGTPLFHRDGRVKAWVGMNTDIHERKRAEEALTESRRFLRSALDALSAHIAVLDESGVILEVNASWRNFADANGFSGPDHGVGSSYLAALDSAPAEECESHEAARGIRDVLSGRRKKFHLEYPCHSPSVQRWYLMTVTCFAAARPLRVVVAHTEITDRVLATHALQAADRRKDEFLAMLSHELRTPLTPVLMTVASMELDPTLPPSTREDLGMIRRNVELETKLIDDLLDLSRVMTGKLRLRLEPVTLNDAVHQVCGICRPQILERGVRLHLQLDPDAGQVTADAARLQQVLWNVLSNAAKFTPENGDIFVRTQRVRADRVEVRVRDTGRGIPREMLPRIFDAFEQGDSSITRQFGGLGLGLAICRALLDLHQGSIAAECNGPGEGTTFIIGLPADATAPVAASPEFPTAEPALANRVRLLVVEDHVDTARALGRLLRRAGYAVKTAGTVAAALELARQESFDLVVSDLGLPDATGYELMRQLRDRHGIHGIAMSGYGMEEDLRKSQEAGFTEHLIKPISVPQLNQAIRRVCAANASFRPGWADHPIASPE